MFEQTSRYANIEDAQITVPDPTAGGGYPRVIVYKRRRFIPAGENTTVLAEHTVMQGERLDNITVRYLADPAQFWRICDANHVLQPAELEQLGRIVRIVVPGS